METVDIFEKASRKAIRFNTSRGMLSVEDLWTLRVEELDTIWQTLTKQLKEADGESLLSTKKTNPELELQAAIVKHIVEVKLAEREEARNAADKAQRKARIMGLIAEKQMEAEASKSIDELMKELEEL